MKRIVGVHGVHQYGSVDPHRSAAALTALWRELLPGTGATLTVVYYADLLRKPGVHADLNDLDRLEADARSMAESFFAPYVPGSAAGRLSSPLRSAVAACARARGLDEGPLKAYATVLFRETARFLRGGGVFAPHDAVVDRVARRAAGADVLLCHSLGAIVAYETLTRHSAIDVPLWITIGSPLALPEVRRRLRAAPGADGRLPRPPGVRRWINIADTRDPTAGPEGALGRCFDGVDADVHHAYVAPFGHHRADGYLRSRALAETLAEALDGG